MNITGRLPIVTLITDFGLQDEYVGVMKGVILQYAPEARIVDISHLIPPQAIGTAAHLLRRSYRYFPAPSVHLVVVDPGVGSDRAILAIAADNHFFVGPDNGVFTTVFNHATDIAIHRVKAANLLLKNISATFHGRDIMAPVAGQLAVGLAISKVGPAIPKEKCVQLESAACIRLPHTLHGEVIHVDGFGNLCTNICRQDIESFASGREISIQIGKDFSIPLDTTYVIRDKGTVLALYDSQDHLEIAVNQGNAARQLRLSIGAKIIVLQETQIGKE
jgi:S-adenosyl-L-methionine hydrolase (adenosine-forming)